MRNTKDYPSVRVILIDNPHTISPRAVERIDKQKDGHDEQDYFRSHPPFSFFDFTFFREKSNREHRS